MLEFTLVLLLASTSPSLDGPEEGPITTEEIIPVPVVERGGRLQEEEPEREHEPARTCGNGGWCPSQDQGSAEHTLPGGNK